MHTCTDNAAISWMKSLKNPTGGCSNLKHTTLKSLMEQEKLTQMLTLYQDENAAPVDVKRTYILLVIVKMNQVITAHGLKYVQLPVTRQPKISLPLKMAVCLRVGNLTHSVKPS